MDSGASIHAIMEYLGQFNIVSVIFRLLLALLAGGVIGYGRARKRRNAGLRTYMLTSVGAALTILISIYEYQMLYGAWAYAAEYAELKFDASRYAGQVVTGIGFLAAGTIIASRHLQVSGLTSAIGLFAAACLGIASGAGYYALVLFATVLIVVAMEAMQPLEVGYKRRLRNITIFVEFDSIDDVGTISETLTEQGAEIFDIDVERTMREGDEYPSATFILKLAKKNASHSALLSSVAEMACVYSIQELIS